MKAAGLILGIIEFGKSVGNLAASDKLYKALGDLGPMIRGTGQRRGLNGVVNDEGRIPELVLGDLFKKCKLQRPQASLL